MIKKSAGFSLIELVLFIAVTSILATTILLSFKITLGNVPAVHFDVIATQLADRCMEGFIGERHLLGYTNSALACSTSPPLPAVCSTLTGYTISATITCLPILSGDTVTSKTVVVSVTGLGNATLTTLLANY
jgi:type II secretory pathway pseudopilin PulG